jgi:hypothetical protein
MAIDMKGEIGGVKKVYIYGGAGILIVTIGVVYYRSKKTAAAAAANATTATVTDPAGNVCAALSPTSGYCPGSPQDLAYSGESGTPVGVDSSSDVGGQIIGYDQYGNPIYSGSGPTTNTGPGTFTNNAEWAQAAQTYLVDNEPSADPGAIGDALGAYIEGQPITAAQEQIVEQAIAFEGSPPVGGTNGNPPGIVTASGGTPPVTTTKVTVPRVVGDRVEDATSALSALGLASTFGTRKPNVPYWVTAQSPTAGTKVAAKSKVKLTISTKQPKG